MISSMTKPVTVLFLGSLTHSDDTTFLDKTRPHEDQIDFQNPVKISLIRIPRPGKDIYSRHISITQNQTIKNFEIYYRNTEKTGGRYSLLTSNNELLVSSTDDILITPKQPIFTDLLLIKGNFTKITFCIYGIVIAEESLLREKCSNYRNNAYIEPINQSLIQIKQDIFQEKRKVIKELESSIVSQNSAEQWHSVINDDGINEQQIENICNLSQKLLTTFTSQQLSRESFVTEFRSGLEQISANLAKIFKNNHLGLYYPSYQDSNISNDLPLSITKLAINSLELSLSEQFRGLQILKFMLQLDRHSEFFIQNQGIQKLIKIFVDFFKINTVVLSTYKNLVLQVLISIGHWKKAAEKMTLIIQDSYYHELFEQRVQATKQKSGQQRERSRQKKTKKSRSDSSSSSQEQDKKKKKDKQKKGKKDKDKQKKKGKESKSKEQILKKVQQVQPQISTTLRDQVPSISFYQILFFQLSRQSNSKQLILIKILLQQILQTITKNKIVSHRVSLSTSLLKDLKYIFNPAGEVLNTKSLKQFASCYQPFLNNVQSQGVQSEIISEKEKLKNMRKYGINPKICKILNKISLQIAASQCQENQEETKTPFDSSFIVMMSELIRYRQKSVLYGFGRMLTTFKIGSSNDIIYLKKIEAAMTMISQYIYKILVQDNGLYTVLNIDQIYTSLINITNCLSKDPSAFTKQLKRKVRQLTNYAMAYDLFNRSQGNFKSISDYFLRLFKFEHYEINKISDFKKKQFDKLTKPFTVTNLSDSVNLGSFHELFPEQPLLQIDVYLKIFNVLLQYNKNVWALFYENKLLCGFSVLYLKLSNVVIFHLQSSMERQSTLLAQKKGLSTIQNYLSVLCRLMNILAKKSQYQSAFNDLIEQDSFENVELYQKSFQLYVSLFNSIYQNSSLLNKKCKMIALQILSMILEIYDKLIQSYQFTSHSTRQNKLKQLWYIIYQQHYTNIKSRGACLSLFSFFIETMENTSTKLFNSYCIDQNVKLDLYTQHSLKGYIPNNDKSIIQNLILTNIYRHDPIIQTNLCWIISNLIDKHSQKNPISEKITSFLEDIFDDIESQIKQKTNMIFQSKKQLVLIEKMVLFTDILRKLNCVLTTKFQEKLLKYLKAIDTIKRDSQENYFKQTAYKLSLKIKTNIISFLKKTFSQKSQHPQLLSFIQLLNKNLDIPPKIVTSILNNSFENLTELQYSIEIQSLNLINSSLDVTCSLSSNPFNQSVILYEVFLEKPYKPSPQLTLINLYNKISMNQFINFIISDDNKMKLEGVQNQSQQLPCSQVKKVLKQIIARMVYFLCQLTTIESRQFYSTESRRNAIVCLLTEDRQFPFSKIQPYKSVIPKQFIETLKDYYSYPIIQKPLTIKTEERKQIIKNKGYLYSKSLFTIIMEGQLTAKSRYPYIGGPWKSGDIKSKILYTPSRQRDYLKIVNKSLKPLNFLKGKIESAFKTNVSVLKQNNVEIQLFQLNTKKRTKNVEKKPSNDTQIKLVNVPAILENQGFNSKAQQNQMIKKISPSPSKYSSLGGFNKGTSSSQYDNGIKRTSPSPPAIKMPPQNMIGFSSMNGINNQSLNQNGMQNNGYTQQSSSMSSQMGNMPQSLNGQPISSMNASMNQKISPMKPTNIQYPEYQNPASSSLIQNPPVYPNPYYGGNIAQRNNEIPITSAMVPPSTNPYSDIQRISQQGSGVQIRSSSNSASRQPMSYQNSSMPYQQPYYNPNTGSPYVGQGSQKIGNYDNRSHSPYQKTYPVSQNNPNQGYTPNPRMNYSASMPNSSYYPNSQNQSGTGGYGGNYGQGNTMGSNPRQGGYQGMGNRQYNQNNPQHYNYNYSSPPSSSSSYTAYQNPQNFGYSEQEKQFNEAILLVTQLRGTLPEHLKQDKKSRLNQILVNNIKVQNRVKQYVNSLK